MIIIRPALIFLTLCVEIANAQFQFFEQMFNHGGQGGGGGHGQSSHQQQPNAGSDSLWYRQQHEAANCDRYLCPQTLSCVHFPHHCPCAFPTVEEKVEFGEGSMLCTSRNGWTSGEVMRKIELARKGLL